MNRPKKVDKIRQSAISTIPTAIKINFIACSGPAKAVADYLLFQDGLKAALKLT